MLDTSGLQLACAIVLVVFGFYHLVLACVVIIHGYSDEKETRGRCTTSRPTTSSWK